MAMLQGLTPLLDSPLRVSHQRLGRLGRQLHSVLQVLRLEQKQHCRKKFRFNANGVVHKVSDAVIGPYYKSFLCGAARAPDSPNGRAALKVGKGLLQKLLYKSAPEELAQYAAISQVIGMLIQANGVCLSIEGSQLIPLRKRIMLTRMLWQCRQRAWCSG